MIWIIAVVIIVLQLPGMVSSYPVRGFVHLLLVIAVIMVLVNIFNGRRAV